MSAFYELLQKIKENPRVYLGKRSLIALKAFLAGYNLAKHELGLDITEQEREFEAFQKWVEGLGNLKSDKSWDKIIFLYSEDDIVALDKFFALYEQFYNRNNREQI